VSFVTTQPESLTAAAGALQTLGTAMAAQNAAAAAPTTSVVPAAADSVSALQAAQFSAYGTWYQQVSDQAAAVHQMLVNTLGANAGSYGEAESANQTAAGSTSLSGLLGGLTGSGTSSSAVSGAAAAPTVSSSTGATIGTPFNYFQNVGAAASDFIALGQGQFLPGAVSWDPSGAGASAAPGVAPGPIPVSAVASAVPVGAPVLAGMGQASSMGGLSVPPGWAAGGAVQTANAEAPAAATAGWSGPAAHPPGVTAVPGGVPSVASAGRGGLGFGAPRYGVKPTVMPRPTFV
jgi:PE family/PPE-SVP subfamily C-terminal region